MKTQLHRVLLAFAAAAFLAGCDASINAPVEIEDGTKDASGRSTVNGSIRVGDDVTVTSGAFRSVNGSARIGSRSTVPSVTLVNGAITVGTKSTTGELETVNGDITVGDGTRVDASIESVNGAVTLATGAEVAKSIHTVNGRITLDGATVHGDLENVNGGMSLNGPSLVNGNLAVRRPKGVDTSDTVPIIVIGAEARVVGSLTFEREVKLQIHRGAQVGEIIGATPEYVDE
jgi:DUF4097 and DUF4098 domain-containing protein YvlB